MTAMRTFFAVLALAVPAVLAGGSLAAPPTAAVSLDVPGLEQPASVVRDSLGIPYVFAHSDHDAYFLVGWLHAQDRLFQMDQSRRQASGTLAELLGSAALPNDVQLRTLGLRRAAEKSLAASSAARWPTSRPTALASTPTSPRIRCRRSTPRSSCIVPALDSARQRRSREAALVRARIRDERHRQHAAADRLSHGPRRGRRLRPLRRGRDADRAVCARAVDPSRRELGPAGTRQALLVELLPGALDARHAAEAKRKLDAAGIGTNLDTGSNVWLVPGRSPRRAADGRERPAPRAFVADAVLRVGIRAKDLVLFGVTFPGLPSIVHGLNEHIAWGSTVNPTT